MAILKHVYIRNSDYGAVQRYLLFEHDPITQKPVLDESGDMVMRREYILTALNCDPMTFNTECTELNRKYRKNQARKDIKAHHYIISFDPRDQEENGLTPEKVQAIGVEFAKKFFAGHQTIIVTHSDGHNHSGNLHCHIVFNSLRKETVSWQDFMERRQDSLGGYKYHRSPKVLRYMQAELNAICTREHLHTVEFGTPAEKNVTEREYWAAQRGQRELDAVNKRIRDAGLTPSRDTFETTKEKLRHAIEEAIRHAQSEADFIRIMREEHEVTVKIRRGIYTYFVDGRRKGIRGRSLGSIYDRDTILQQLGMESLHREPIPVEFADMPRIFLIPSRLQLVVDLQKSVKAQQSRAYARKVGISNLQRMADTVSYINENGIDTIEKLQEAYRKAEDQYAKASAKLDAAKAELRQTNEIIHWLGVYLSHKSTYKEFLASKNKGKYRTEHQEEISQYEESVRFLKKAYPDRSYPTMKQLKARKAELHEKRDKQQEALAPYAEQRRTMNTIIHNVSTILGGDVLEQRQEQH